MSNTGGISLIIIIVALLLSMLAGHFIAQGALCLIELLLLEDGKEIENVHAKRLVFIPVIRDGESESKSDSD